MTKPSNDPHPVPAHPEPSQVVKEQRQKAENNEVAGRHKNDGQKDHKGAQ